MLEIISKLPKQSLVIDLGCDNGSFPQECLQATVIRVDLEPKPISINGGNFVQADACKLPFPDHSIRAVISNHSLEHISEYKTALKEIGRVLEANGILYVAVPDARTLTDKLYRWLARGGGHINAFTDATKLADEISEITGLTLAGIRILHSGMSFFNLRNSGRPPIRAWLLGGGYEPFLIISTYLFRVIDHAIGTRLSVYGWALYFGSFSESIDLEPRSNVCIRCGAGHSSEWLASQNMIGTLLFLKYYNCPQCTALNLYTSR